MWTTCGCYLLIFENVSLSDFIPKVFDIFFSSGALGRNIIICSQFTALTKINNN